MTNQDQQQASPPYHPPPQSHQNTPPEQNKDKRSWLRGSISVFSILILLVFWGVNYARNQETKNQNDQVEADVHSEVDSLSDIENEIKDGKFSEKAGNIEIGASRFESVDSTKIRLEMELINHGSKIKEVECSVKAGTTDTLRKIHTGTYDVPSGSHQFVEVIEVANADSEFLETYIECLAYE